MFPELTANIYSRVPCQRPGWRQPQSCQASPCTLRSCLLRLAAVEQTDRVVLSNRACERFGLDRNAKYRALLSLEGCGADQSASEN